MVNVRLSPEACRSWNCNSLFVYVEFRGSRHRHGETGAYLSAGLRRTLPTIRPVPVIVRVPTSVVTPGARGYASTPMFKSGQLARLRRREAPRQYDRRPRIYRLSRRSMGRTLGTRRSRLSSPEVPSDATVTPKTGAPPKELTTRPISVAFRLIQSEPALAEPPLVTVTPAVTGEYQPVFDAERT